MAHAPSAEGMAIGGAPLLIKPRVDPMEYEQVLLSHKVVRGQLGGNDNIEKVTVRCPKITGDDIELLLTAIKEFDDISTAARLNLSNGDLLYSNFREILDTVFREIWDRVRQGQANTVNGFQAAVDLLIADRMRVSCIGDQKYYFQTYTKKRSESVDYIGNRLLKLVGLMNYFRGAGRDANGARNQVVSAQERKLYLYQMMPLPWKETFSLHSEHLLHDANYTYAQLVSSFASQERISNSRESRNRNIAGRGGRGRGDGGRYNRSGRSGRGGPGRGRGGPIRQNFQQSQGQGANNCPYHPGRHPWSMCIGNPQSSNYNPNYVFRGPGQGGYIRRNDGNRGGRGRGNQGGRNQGGRGQAFVVQDPGDVAYAAPAPAAAAFAVHEDETGEEGQGQDPGDVSYGGEDQQGNDDSFWLNQWFPQNEMYHNDDPGDFVADNNDPGDYGYDEGDY